MNEQHTGVMKAFAARILRGEPLVAEGVEGIRGLTLSNAMFLSSWLNLAAAAWRLALIRAICASYSASRSS